MTSTQYKTNKRFSWSELRPTRGLSSANAAARGGREEGARTQGAGRGAGLRAPPRSLSVWSAAGGEWTPHPLLPDFEAFSSARPRSPPVPARGSGMPASMFSIDNILAARPRCKDSVLPVAPSAAAPVVFPALHGDSLYGASGGTSSDYGAFYPRSVAPGGAGLPAAVGGSRLGYNNYFYGQLHVQAAPVGPACCGAVPPLGAQQCSCVPTPPGRVAIARACAATAVLSHRGMDRWCILYSSCTDSLLATLSPLLWADWAQGFAPTSASKLLGES